MKIFLKISVLLSILFFNFETVYAEETLQYVLTPDKVEMACVYQIRHGMKKGLYEIGINLNEPNKKIFSQLTGDNIGKRLAIIFEGRILIKPITIRAKIDSGAMSGGEWNSEDDARKVVDILDPNHKGEKRNLKFLSETIRFSTKKQLADLIYGYENEKFSIYDLLNFYELMDNKETTLKRKEPPNIQVRDIAFAVIQKMTGEDFLCNNKTYKIKETLSGVSEAGPSYEFEIPSLSDDEYKDLKCKLKYWIDGYQAGNKKM